MAGTIRVCARRVSKAPLRRDKDIEVLSVGAYLDGREGCAHLARLDGARSPTRPNRGGWGTGDRSEPGCSNPRGGECRESSSTTGCCGTPCAGAATEACEDKSQHRERHASWQSNAVMQLPGSRPWRRWTGPTGPRSWHGAPNPVEPARQWRLSLSQA